jgi:hypothetical protein
VADPTTRDIEAEARALAARNFQPRAAQGFVQRTCAWGGYHGIGGRVLKHNSLEDVVGALRAAPRPCAEDKPVEGLRRLTGLKNLGVSFASKHLKFLNPSKAAVLDSIISTHLRYPLNLVGYGEFLANCNALLAAVRDAGVPFLFPEEGTWWLSNVKRCLYQQVRS